MRGVNRYARHLRSAFSQKTRNHTDVLRRLQRQRQLIHTNSESLFIVKPDRYRTPRCINLRTLSVDAAKLSNGGMFLSPP